MVNIMSKFNVLQDQYNELLKRNEKLEKDQQIFREKLFRLTAQSARPHVEKSELVFLRNQIRDLCYNSFSETAISIFEWVKLPTPSTKGGTVFDSKRIEKQIERFGRVCLFKNKYRFTNFYGNTEEREEFLVLPFTGVSGLDCYGEFSIIRPYAAQGGEQVFDDLIVNKDCVILSDYFIPTQTSANASFTIKAGIEFYANEIADCEVAKKINRRWLKMPMLFTTDNPEDKEFKNNAQALALEVKQLLQCADDNEEAYISRVVPYIKILPTGAQYYGKELDEQIKSYKNELFEFLGIAHNSNEKKERQITNEIEVATDQYNINITKRLQNRLKALKQAKELWKDYFKDVTIKVNLNGFNEKDKEINNYVDTYDYARNDR